MTAPRMSIIPAGAVFDRSLEPRDLQVLCLLGIHTNKLGWCFKSQVGMARDLGCGRSSIQRSLDRLYASDWVEKRMRSRGKAPINPDRPHAAHAYRVKLDRQDIKFDLLDDGTELEDGPDDAEGCPPVGTGCPPMVGTGCPRMHGHMNVDSNDSVVVFGAPSSDAEKIASEIAALANVDEAKDAKWFEVGPAVIVQRFLDAGYLRWQLIEGVKRGMLSRTQSPRDIRYFITIWQRVRGEAEVPAPPPTVSGPSKSAHRQPRPGSREDRQERTANARRQLREYAYGSDADGQDRSGEAGGSIPSGLPLPKPA